MFLANVIQIGLAELLRQDMMEFIEKNAARFREVVNDDPSLFERYQEDSEGTLRVILGRMQVH